MNTRLLAVRSWLAKAEAEEDEFYRFIAAWLAFNALYSAFARDSDRQAISDLVFSEQHELPRWKILAIVGGTAARFFSKHVIRDVRGSGSDTREAARVMECREWSAKKRLKALLSILYMVRCNLFHGDKVYAREADHQIVRMASAALLPVLRAYVGTVPLQTHGRPDRTEATGRGLPA